MKPARITFIAMMAALASILTLVTAAIPNFSISLAFFLFTADLTGFPDSSLIMILTVLLSNLRTGGLGIWTLGQMLVYLLLLAIWGISTQCLNLKRLISRSLLAGLLALAFGFGNAIFTVIVFGLPHFWPYYGQGLLFDLSYSLATVLSYPLLRHFVYPWFKKRLNL